MAVTVKIGQSLSESAGGETTFVVEGATFGDLIDAIDQDHPGFRDQILNGELLTGWVLVSGGGRGAGFHFASDRVTDGTTVTISMNVPGG